MNDEAGNAGSKLESTRCCVVGGGPAGVILALLLARKKVPVVLLEAHKDFDRDFRGDTVHPITMELMDRLGLADKVAKLGLAKLSSVGVRFGETEIQLADFGLLDTKFPYITMMPQERLLELLTGEAGTFPDFSLRMQSEARELIEEDGQVCGVRYRDPEGEGELRADLVVAADGRHSRLRKLTGFEPIKTAPPMDVLWFRLPKKPEDAGDSKVSFRISSGHLLVILDRDKEWQIAYTIIKGSFREVKQAGIEALRDSLVRMMPSFADRVELLKDFKDLTPLNVESSRLLIWHKPGLLLIGDAAHVMSPVGGVGINYAIQDAVAAANLLAEPLRAGRVTDRDLAAVQADRERSVKIIQRAQALIQSRIVAQAFKADEPFRLPFFLRLKPVRRLLARLIAFGYRPARLAE